MEYSMAKNSLPAGLLGTETLEDCVERAAARPMIREEQRTLTSVVHNGTLLSLADNCATCTANRANNDGPIPGAIMLLIDLHSTMLGINRIAC
jgi:acyl-coenzyme A thioesterase PaaI-like protein